MNRANISDASFSSSDDMAHATPGPGPTSHYSSARGLPQLLNTATPFGHGFRGNQSALAHLTSVHGDSAEFRTPYSPSPLANHHKRARTDDYSYSFMEDENSPPVSPITPRSVF